MTTYLAIDPVDVLALRGNRLFSDGPSACPMPPWPSVFAGAIRSRILTDRRIEFIDIKEGAIDDDAVRDALGTYDAPGPFRISFLGLHDTTTQTFWVPMPADLAGVENDHATRAINVLTMHLALVSGLQVGGSFELPKVPVLRQAERDKALSGLWLSLHDLGRYLEGHAGNGFTPQRSSAFWLSDPRLGIALDTAKRTVREGMLYTTDIVALTPNTVLVVGVVGADEVIPRDGLVRLGGDGHAARVDVIEAPNPPGPTRVEAKFRMVLATPGLFEGGWLPPGVEKAGGAWELRCGGFKAHLVAAAVPRCEVVSGWDLAERRPKPAERVVPTGAVYWFEQVEGSDDDRNNLVAALRAQGLWALEPELSKERKARQSEGFNNVWLGNWGREAS